MALLTFNRRHWRAEHFLQSGNNVVDGNEMLAAISSDHKALQGVFIEMIKRAPQLAAVMGGHATLALGGSESRA